MPFAGFFHLGGLAPHEIPVDIDDRLDENAALIPSMILILRKLARIWEEVREQGTFEASWFPPLQARGVHNCAIRHASLLYGR